MARQRPRATPAPAPDGSPRGAFEGLAGLKRKLRAAAPGSAAPGPAPRDAAAPGPEEDSRALLDGALRGVQPLSPSHRRADLARPAPPPVPRPKVAAPDDDIPAAPRRRRPPRSDAEWFREEMQGVTPLAPSPRVETGPRDRRYPPAGPAAQDGGTPADAPLRPALDPDTAAPAELFRHAVRGAQPIDARDRVELEKPPPPPWPLKRAEDEREALRESLENAPTVEDRLEMGDEASFLRPGLPRRVLTDLRRGRWVLQGQLDLHGLNRDEAREALSQFIAACLQQGRRCVRVIHGKGLGSPGKESILKQLSRGWLAQREEILAFCQAGPHDGGGGALLVLLRTANRTRSA